MAEKRLTGKEARDILTKAAKRVSDAEARDILTSNSGERISAADAREVLTQPSGKRVSDTEARDILQAAGRKPLPLFGSDTEALAKEMLDHERRLAPDEATPPPLGGIEDTLADGNSTEPTPSVPEFEDESEEKTPAEKQQERIEALYKAAHERATDLYTDTLKAFEAAKKEAEEDVRSFNGDIESADTLISTSKQPLPELVTAKQNAKEATERVNAKIEEIGSLLESASKALDERDGESATLRIIQNNLRKADESIDELATLRADICNGEGTALNQLYTACDHQMVANGHGAQAAPEVSETTGKGTTPTVPEPEKPATPEPAKPEAKKPAPEPAKPEAKKPAPEPAKPEAEKPKPKGEKFEWEKAQYGGSLTSLKYGSGRKEKGIKDNIEFLQGELHDLNAYQNDRTREDNADRIFGNDTKGAVTLVQQAFKDAGASIKVDGKAYVQTWAALAALKETGTKLTADGKIPEDAKEKVLEAYKENLGQSGKLVLGTQELGNTAIAQNGVDPKSITATAEAGLESGKGAA